MLTPIKKRLNNRPFHTGCLLGFWLALAFLVLNPVERQSIFALLRTLITFCSLPMLIGVYLYQSNTRIVELAGAILQICAAILLGSMFGVSAYLTFTAK